MRAALLREAGNPVEITDVDLRSPAHGEVQVAVKHCGLCHSDLDQIDGAFPAPLPIVLGHEAAGVVEEVGPGVTGLAEGDHVILTPNAPCGRCPRCARGEFAICVQSQSIITHTLPDGSTPLSLAGEPVYRGLGLGAFAEGVIVSQTGAVKIPDDVPLDVACVVGCAVQTGVGAVLNTANVTEGDSVLIMGLGGVGLSIVQGAVLAGASRIIISDPVSSRRDAAMRFGATDTLDPTRDDVSASVMDLTNGAGVDWAFDAAGNSALLRTGLAVTRMGGTTVAVGAPKMDDPLTISPVGLLIITEKKLVGSSIGSCNPLRDIPRFVSLWQAGRLDLEGLVTAHRPLEELNEACDDMRAGRGIRTVLDI